MTTTLKTMTDADLKFQIATLRKAVRGGAGDDAQFALDDALGESDARKAAARKLAAMSAPVAQKKYVTAPWRRGEGR